MEDDVKLLFQEKLAERLEEFEYIDADLNELIEIWEQVIITEAKRICRIK